ncbi:uncharacterized protein Tco025E_06858, partial [Trypanosoma conorhini]
CTPKEMTPGLDAVPRLWATRTPQRGTAASATETRTTSPLEEVPRRARCGEVERPACRPADKTARPLHDSHPSVLNRHGIECVSALFPPPCATPPGPAENTSLDEMPPGVRNALVAASLRCAAGCARFCF